NPRGGVHRGALRFIRRTLSESLRGVGHGLLRLKWRSAVGPSHDHTVQAKARESGARLVFSCGFDSVPSDMGSFFLQQQCLERFNEPAERVQMRPRILKGGLS